MSAVFVVFQAILPLILTLATSADGYWTIDGYWTAQKSVYNKKTSDLAMDRDPLTCAETGFDSSGWWTVDLGKPKDILGFKLKGSCAPFQIRIGNDSEPLGRRTPSETNALCLQSSAIEPTYTLDMPCRHNIKGRYISVVVVDPVSSRQLKLCDLQILFA